MPGGEPTIDDILAGGRRREVVSITVTGVGPVTFTFEALRARGKGSWQEMKDQHPPSDADRGLGLGLDLDSFIPAALAACCVSPKMTVEKAVHLIEDIATGGQFDALWDACLLANSGVNRPESSAASAPTVRTRRSSKPRSAPAGRTRSS